jgi:probable phosphoglycerate mutase
MAVGTLVATRRSTRPTSSARQDTASVIAAASSSSSSSAVRAHAALRERHAGSLQGIRRADAPARDPKAWKALRGGDDATRVPGGGESYDDVWDRVVPWFEDEARARARARAAAAGEGGGRGGGRGVVVTHGGVIHVLSDRCEADDEWFATSGRGRGRVVAKNCAVGVLRLHVPREDDAAGERRVRWRIGETWGDASHLEEGGLRSSAWGGGAAGV